MNLLSLTALILNALSISIQLLEVDCVKFTPHVTTVEESPRSAVGLMLFPLGHVWCNGKPMIYPNGHGGSNDTPRCLVTNYTGRFEDYNFKGSVWEERPQTKFGTKGDYHEAVSIDLNNDNVLDMVYLRGARKGTGSSYQEIYITDPAEKVPVLLDEGYGLWIYTTMRTRFAATLKSADGSSLLMIVNHGGPRDDGRPNHHRIFKLTHPSPHEFLFVELPEPRPWAKETSASSLKVADINKDGLDDIIVCNHDVPADIYIQNKRGGFDSLDMSDVKDVWRNVRVADMDNDGINDLVVVGSGAVRNPKFRHGRKSYVQVFKGTRNYPFFNFTSIAGTYFKKEIRNSTPDVEIVDFNRDGINDMYVLQTDEKSFGSYCLGSKQFNRSNFWSPEMKHPPEGWVPPLNKAKDLLFVGRLDEMKFSKKTIKIPKVGCGTRVQTFGNNHTLVLSQAQVQRQGQTFLLQW